MVRWLVGALGASCLMSLPACSDPAAPTPAEVNLPAGSLTYVRPAPQDVVSGLMLRIGRKEPSPLPLAGLAFECPMRWDGARFVCDLPVTVEAAREHWVYVRDPARPNGVPKMPGICSPSYEVADGISVLNQSVVRPTNLYASHLCNFTAGCSRSVQRERSADGRPTPVLTCLPFPS
jgi:hypothetical protein